MEHGLYFRGHKTDSILGRVGNTFDWVQSIPGGLPLDWGNYPHPPYKSDWRSFLPLAPHLIARNAVRPFALYFDVQCNLILLSSQALNLLGRTIDLCCTDPRSVQISFGKKTFEYRAMRVAYCFQWSNNDNSALSFPASRFARFGRRDYHVHGTKVSRAELPSWAGPVPVEASLVADGPDDPAIGFKNLTQVVPESLTLNLPFLPTLFAYEQSIYVKINVAMPMASLRDAGISFPYEGLHVQTTE